MGSVFKEFSESYNQANEKWGEPASHKVTKVVSVDFKETISENALKNLLTKVTQPENWSICSQTKLVNPVAFATVSPSIRSTVLCQEVQRNMSKMTGCLTRLLLQLPNILKINGDYKDGKLKAIQTT